MCERDRIYSIRVHSMFRSVAICSLFFRNFFPFFFGFFTSKCTFPFRSIYRNGLCPISRGRFGCITQLFIMTEQEQPPPEQQQPIQPENLSRGLEHVVQIPFLFENIRGQTQVHFEFQTNIL